jgi:hypothetical protein
VVGMLLMAEQRNENLANSWHGMLTASYFTWRATEMSVVSTSPSWSWCHCYQDLYPLCTFSSSNQQLLDETSTVEFYPTEVF